MSARTTTLLIAILGTIGTVLSTLTDSSSSFHMSPAVALLVGALGSGCYGLVRALQKVKAGTPWKSLLSTTEAKGALIVYLAALFTAVAKVVPASYAGVATLAVTGLLALGRAITNGTGTGPTKAALILFLSFGAISLTANAQAVTPAPATVTPTAVTPAQKATPQLGGCTASGVLCWQPAVAVSALQVNLKTWDYERVSLQAGYGLVYKGWKANLGAAIYGGVGISSKQPNAPQGSILFSVADLGALGPGLETYKDPTDPNHRIWQVLWTFAVNYNIGGSMTFIEKVFDAANATGRASARLGDVGDSAGAGSLSAKDF